MPTELGKLQVMSTEGERLGRYVLARRDELDLTQIEVWHAGGPSNTSLTKIEGGLLESLSRATARKLDRGLQWEPGSAKVIWAGGEPTKVLAGVDPDLSARARKIVEDMDIDEEVRDVILRGLNSA